MNTRHAKIDNAVEAALEAMRFRGADRVVDEQHVLEIYRRVFTAVPDATVGEVDDALVRTGGSREDAVTKVQSIARRHHPRPSEPIRDIIERAKGAGD